MADSFSIASRQSQLFQPWDADRPLKSAKVQGVGQLASIDARSKAMYVALAQESGESPSVLIEDLWTGYEFNALVDRFSVKYPNLYVGASRANPAETSSKYDLAFTKYPPKDVVSELRDLPFDVNVKYGAPLSNKQLQKVRDQVVQRAARLGLSLMVDFSPLGTFVRMTYKTPSGEHMSVSGRRRQLKTYAEALLARQVEQGRAAPGVKVRVDPALTGHVPFVEMKAGFGYSGCTSGFAATLNGREGLLTAKHCTDRPFYMSTGVQMNDAVNASSGIDIQFNAAPSPHTVVRRFRINSAGDTKSVTGVANPVYGDAVAKYGVKTGYSFGFVTSADMCDVGGPCHLFKANMTGDHGDSGGPCFSGQAARGVLQGGDDVDHSYVFCTRISSSPATVLQW